MLIHQKEQKSKPHGILIYITLAYTKHAPDMPHYIIAFKQIATTSFQICIDCILPRMHAATWVAIAKGKKCPQKQECKHTANTQICTLTHTHANKPLPQTLHAIQVKAEYNNIVYQNTERERKHTTN